jgi:predicted DNA-binding transcriptional regulator YafY
MSQHDTLMRHLALLRMIPRHPTKRATTTLHEKLAEEGFTLTPRSLQRDLEKLSAWFPLTCDNSEKPYRWSYVANYASDLPAMDTVEALVLVMAEQGLTDKLPPSALSHIRHRFERARKHLDSLQANGLSHWNKRVSSIAEGKSLIAPEVGAGIWEAISDALLNQQAIEVDYLSRSRQELKHYTVHPQGLVTRGATSYVLATIGKHEDIRQLALHRFQAVRDSSKDYRALPDFNVQDYIDEGSFGLPVASEPIQLVAQINSHVAWKLRETPVSTDQTLSEPDADGWIELRATVPNDQQTLWWTLGFGAGFHVQQPTAWRDHLAAQAEAILARAKQHGYRPTRGKTA